MIEPVAWRYTDCGYYRVTKEKPNPAWDYKDIEPLYTSEQLHPRVRMTQVEFDDFEEARSIYNRPTDFLKELDLDYIRSQFLNLFHWIYKKEHGNDLECELLFNKLWVDYELDKKDGAIKIVPETKWFVRSKEPSNDGSYLFRSGIKDFGDYYYTKDKNENKIAYPFDTKEEAEKWTNPLTEAVQLPVEGDND